MKKILFAVIVIAFSLCSCSMSDDIPQKGTSALDASEEQALDERYAIDEEREKEYALQDAAESDPESIPYSKAHDYIGEYVTLYGYIMDVDTDSANANPTFVDLGESYPSKDRVTGILWPEYESAFPDIKKLEGHVVYMEGTLYEHNGIANIELTDSFQIRAAE